MRAAYVVAYSQEREKRVERGREQKQDLKNERAAEEEFLARPLPVCSPDAGLPLASRLRARHSRHPLRRGTDYGESLLSFTPMSDCVMSTRVGTCRSVSNYLAIDSQLSI